MTRFRTAFLILLAGAAGCAGDGSIKSLAPSPFDRAEPPLFDNFPHNAALERAYEVLRSEGPAAALPLFEAADANHHPESPRHYLLPQLAWLYHVTGDEPRARQHLAEARLAAEVERGTYLCTNDHELRPRPPTSPAVIGAVTERMCSAFTVDWEPMEPDPVYSAKLAAAERLIEGR